jgi:hypothetical protein
MKTLDCPACGSTNVWPSRPQRMRDVIPFILFLRPARCLYCKARFYCWRWREFEAVRRPKYSS